MAQKVIVLIGDVVASRKIKERTIFDRTLSKTIETLNQNTYTLSPYTITIGDEIQAVFDRADTLLHDVAFILAAIYPEKMRFSFGVGELITPINPDQAIGMDGPAFYGARDGIDELKRAGHLLDICGEGIPHLNLLRQTLFLISYNMSKWNKTRLQVLTMQLKHLPVKEIAARIGFSDKAVYKSIRAGALDVIIELFKEIEAILNEHLDSLK